MHQLRNNLLFNIIISMRPKQWTKNLFIFAAILFSQNIFNWCMLLRVIYIFAVFSLLSSSVYLINDVFDVEKDKNHPKKKNRPIAAGKVPIWMGVAMGLLLAALSLTVAFYLNIYTGIISSIYLLQSVLYSTYFKNIVIMDVLFISFGFVLRVIVGGLAINVPVSVWLLICATMLSLFLALCKRRHEIVLLSGNAGSHRKILDDYSTVLLDQMISVVTSSTLVVYSLYTFMAYTNKNMMFTIPFVLYGIFRYLYLVHKQEGGGEPEDIVIKDKPMILNILFWILAAELALY